MALILSLGLISTLVNLSIISHLDRPGGFRDVGRLMLTVANGRKREYKFKNSQKLADERLLNKKVTNLLFF